MAGYDKKRRHERYIKNKERENAQSKAYKELPVDGGSMKSFVEVDEDFEVMMTLAKNIYHYTHLRLPYPSRKQRTFFSQDPHCNGRRPY